jgi:hypothetical protein
MAPPARLGSSPDRISEAQVVYWLKNALTTGQFSGQPAHGVLVDADGAYLNSPFRRHLQPTGTIRIGGWRADLLCVLERGGVERLLGFEVKAWSDLEKGVVQATRYRLGVHEAYLCIPALPHEPPDWLFTMAQQNGVGLARASAAGVEIPVPPPPLRPDPRILLATRSYLLGEDSVRALSLNKPLHYVAALVAFDTTDDPARLLVEGWGLGEAAVRHAVKGAQILGLIAADRVTPKGRAYADAFRALGFNLERDRYLTARRLADHNPGYAAIVRAILLDNPAVSLIVRVLAACGGGPITADVLGERAHAIDEGMAQAVFGPRPEPGGSWHIRPSTRFQLKAGLYDCGLLSTKLSRGAGSLRGLDLYDPTRDEWALT